jgi:hypothetical protein
MASDDEDFCAAAGARVLADQVADYWRSRGHAGVKTWIEAGPTENRRPVYIIRSNLTGGRPPA